MPGSRARSQTPAFVAHVDEQPVEARWDVVRLHASARLISSAVERRLHTAMAGSSNLSSGTVRKKGGPKWQPTDMETTTSPKPVRLVSSVGRASPRHGEGPWFEPTARHVRNTLVVDGLEHVDVFVPRRYGDYSAKVQDTIEAWVRGIAKHYPTLCNVFVDRVVRQDTDRPRVYGSFSWR